jgi:hypothetical protein
MEVGTRFSARTSKPDNTVILYSSQSLYFLLYHLRLLKIEKICKNIKNETKVSLFFRVNMDR